MKTCRCNVCPIKPHFYIVKLGCTVVNLFLLFFYPKHKLWAPRRGGSNVYPQSMFLAKYRNCSGDFFSVRFASQKISVYCMGMFSKCDTTHWKRHEHLALYVYICLINLFFVLCCRCTLLLISLTLIIACVGTIRFVFYV